MKTSRNSVSIVFVILTFFLFGANGARAACINGISGNYADGATISVTATPTAADGISPTDTWAVCIYSGGKVDGGENFPVSRTLPSAGTSKTTSAVVDADANYSGWRAVVMRGSGACNSANTTGAVCSVAINTAGAPNPAAGGGTGTGGGGTGTGGGGTGTGGTGAVNIANPIETGDFTTLVQNVLSWLLSVVGGVALLFLIYGGLVYVTSTGDQQKAQQGKKIVTATILGLIIVLMSYSILVVLDRIFFA